MKKIILIFLVFLTISKSYAQSTGIVVSVEKTKVLYNEIENLFEVSKIPKNSKITIEGCNAILKKENAFGGYTILPKDTGYVKVYLANNNSKILLSTIKVIDLPEPNFRLLPVNISGGMISKLQFVVQSGLIGDLKDFVYEGVRIFVNSYIIVFKNQENIDIINVNGAGMNDEARNKLKEMKTGSTIIITDIKYNVNNGKIRKSNSDLVFVLM
jgi:hypothetical protein